MGLEDMRSRYHDAAQHRGAPAPDPAFGDEYFDLPDPPATQGSAGLGRVPASPPPGDGTGYPAPVSAPLYDDPVPQGGPAPADTRNSPPVPQAPPPGASRGMADAGVPRPVEPARPAAPAAAPRPGPHAPSQRSQASTYDFSRDAQHTPDPDAWGELPAETTGSDARSDPAATGFRGAVNKVLHTSWGKGRSELEYDGWISEINTSLRGARVIGVVSGKGGVGKTSIAAMLGNTLAEHRSVGRVVAVDLDFRGSLADRIADVARTPATSSVAEFANISPDTPVNLYPSYMNTSREGLSILPAVTRTRHPALTGDQFAAVIDKLREYAAIIILDFGADESAMVTHPAYDTLDTVIMVTSTERDSIKAANGRMRAMHDHSSWLTSNMTVVINHRTQAQTTVDLDAEVKLIQGRGMSVLEAQFDPHVGEARAIKLGLCDSATARQMVRLAAMVVAKLPKT